MLHQPRHGGSWISPLVHHGLLFALARHHHRDADGGGRGWPLIGGRGRGGRGNREGDRLFGRGDLKYVILDLLTDRPRHGYDIIRALEVRFHGLYSPSPGAVYPTLQLLEDQGLVTSSQQDGKRMYTLSEVGRAFLIERKETLDAIRARMEAVRGGAAHSELGALMAELHGLAQSIVHRADRRALADPETIRRLRGIVARTRVEIEATLAGEPERTFSDL